MERYFILVIAVTLAGVIAQTKNAQEANFKRLRQRQTNVIAAIATRENSTDHTCTLSSFTKFKIAAGVLPAKKIYKITTCKKSVQKMIKNWPRQRNKMSGSPNLASCLISCDLCLWVNLISFNRK